MNIRSIFLMVVASAIALTAAGAAVASNSATATKSATFHLVEKDVSFNFVDNSPRQGPNAPPLAGDQLVFSSELQTKTGAHAGLARSNMHDRQRRHTRPGGLVLASSLSKVVS